MWNFVSVTLKMPASQSRNFCFTLNNPSEEEFNLLRKEPPIPPTRYTLFGSEVGESGTFHAQGTIVMSKPMTVYAVKKLESMKRAHVEIMKGRLEQSEAYCSKDGKVEMYGDRPRTQKEKGDGEVERFDLARAAAKEGRFDDIASDIYLRNYSSIHKIARDNLIEPPAREVLENYWIFGPSGCGKSVAALEKYGDRAFLKKCDNKWWDGYNPLVHDVVIIEDIAPKQAYQMTNMKIWTDHRAFPAETKGGTMLIRPKIVVVTANHSIDEVFGDEKEATFEDRKALKRRFVLINMFTKTRDDPDCDCFVDDRAKVLELLDAEPPRKKRNIVPPCIPKVVGSLFNEVTGIFTLPKSVNYIVDEGGFFNE